MLARKRLLTFGRFTSKLKKTMRFNFLRFMSTICSSKPLVLLSDNTLTSVNTYLRFHIIFSEKCTSVHVHYNCVMNESNYLLCKVGRPDLML